MNSMDDTVFSYMCVYSGIGSTILSASVATVFVGPVLVFCIR